jgi:hypothetical protein
MPQIHLTKERAAKRLGLSESDVDEFVAAARRTWNAIAHDVLQAVSESGGKKMSRAAVIEVTLDADHVVSFGQIKSAELLAVLKGHDHYRTLVKVLEPYFSEEWV